MLTNNFTCPLSGQPDYRSAGIIKVYDTNNHRYSVGEIVFERYDDQNFQYIIKPYWESIDYLPTGLFQGIPGINMDLRHEAYYRVNMTPAIISMRTPSESRENVRQLMTSAGLDYYDRFEWLLRTESKCGDDNLMIVRKSAKPIKIVGVQEIGKVNLTPEDTLEIHSLSELSSSSAGLVQYVYQILQSGAHIFISDENRYLQSSERRIMLYLLCNMLISIDKSNSNNRKLGRQLAKEAGKYTGRKPIEINEDLLKAVAVDFRKGDISEQEALQKLSVSRSTFYRKLKAMK